MSKRHRQLAEVLLEEELVTYEQLDEASAEQARTGKSLGRILIDLGFVVEQDLVSALAKQIGLPYVDLGEYPIDPAAASLISDNLAKRYSALPIGYEDSRLVVAMSDPANVFALDDIRTITGLEIKPVVATRSEIQAAIQRFHRLDTSIDVIHGGDPTGTASGGPGYRPGGGSAFRPCGGSGRCGRPPRTRNSWLRVESSPIRSDSAR